MSTTEEARLHVTFGQSAAGSLKIALRALRLDEPVAALVDTYSMGPIDPGDPAQRAVWERAEETGMEDAIADSEDVRSFWEQVAAWRGTLVLWFSSRSAKELCGLCELLWRLPAARIRSVDVSKVDFTRRGVALYHEGQAFSSVRDERIVELGLVDEATPMSDIQRAGLRSTWARLRSENAPLRVMTAAGIVSAPIEYFDERIRQAITGEWQKCSRIVGNIIALSEGASDSFVFERLLRVLDDDDDIEGRNDDGHDAPWAMSRSWVRRHPY